MGIIERPHDRLAVDADRLARGPRQAGLPGDDPDLASYLRIEERELEHDAES